MYKLKTLFFVIFIFILLFCPISIKAQQGCCSWHGGVAGCSNGRTLCADGTLSPSCTCGSSSYEYESESDDENEGWRNIIAIVIVVGGFFGFGYILTAIDDYKKRKQEEERERERLERERLYLEQLKRELNDIKNLKFKFANGEHMTTLLKYLNGEITSADIIDIIKVDKNDDVKILLDELYKKVCSKSYYIKESDIFSNICLKIINSDLLNEKVNIVEYILNSYDYNYGNVFIKIIKAGNYSLAKNILKIVTNCKFLFNREEIGEIFNNICNAKEIELADLISKHKGFSYPDYDSCFSLFKRILEEDDKETLKIYCKFFQQYVYCSISYMSDTIDIITKVTDVTLLECYLNQCNDIETFMRENGFKLIFLSIKRLKTKIIEYVLTNYKNINLNMLQDGMTPLMYACYRKNYKIVNALLDYGVDINYVDNHGESALAYACDSRNLKICKLLVERGGVIASPDFMEQIEYAIKKNKSYLLPYISVYTIYLLKNKKHKHK